MSLVIHAQTHPSTRASLCWDKREKEKDKEKEKEKKEKDEKPPVPPGERW